MSRRSPCEEQVEIYGIDKDIASTPERIWMKGGLFTTSACGAEPFPLWGAWVEMILPKKMSG